MAFPTAVNSQITDAVTQSNVKVIGESPAVAMGQIYQAIAHSTGILFENAVAAQQQQNTLAQATANQGVMQIYSVDTVADAVGTAKVGQSDVPDNMLSLLTALKATQTPPAAKAMAVSPEASAETADVATAPTAATVPASDDGGTPDIAQQIRDAVIFVNQTVLGSSNDFIAGLQAAVEAMAHALETVERSAHAARVHVLQEAALAATLAAMLRDPEKAKDYETVLQVIQRMG